VDRRVRATPERIQKALQGNYRREHLFVLGQAFSLHAAVEEKIQACDEQIVREAGLLADQVDPQRQLPTRKEGRPARMDLMQGQDMREVMFRKFGTDLTAIESIGVATALGVLTEVGPSLSGFKTEKHFCSWLGLCPNNRISGGKVLSSRTRKVVNRVADALRMAAVRLERSQSALGGYYRRMKARLGAAEGITATAHKLARLIYRLIKHGQEYVRQGLEDYEAKCQARKLRALQKNAKHLGFSLVAKQQLATSLLER
jgi:transposase